MATKKKKPDASDVADAKETIKKVRPSTRPIQPKVTEQLMFREQSRMFFKLRKIARKMEEDIIDSPNPGRMVYALSTLYSQQREVIADIRSVQDMGAQLSEVESEVLDPLRRQIAGSLTDSFYQLKSLLSHVSKEGELKFALNTLTSLMSDVGSAIDQATQKSSVKLQQVLMPEEQPMQRKRKRR